MKYGMAIDLSTCMGCKTCAVVCKMANNLPAGVWWNRVDVDGGESPDTARGTYPNDLHRVFYPINCQQCSNPGCVSVCPTGASYKREEDGLVLVDESKCIGCGSCIMACPYNVRTLYEDEPTYSVDFPVGDWDAPAHERGTVGKCTFCVNRVERGEVPACMDLCPARARHWGDLDDPDSDVSRALQGREYEKLLEDAGTQPNIFYLK